MYFRLCLCKHLVSVCSQIVIMGVVYFGATAVGNRFCDSCSASCAISLIEDNFMLLMQLVPEIDCLCGMRPSLCMSKKMEIIALYRLEILDWIVAMRCRPRNTEWINESLFRCHFVCFYDPYFAKLLHNMTMYGRRCRRNCPDVQESPEHITSVWHRENAIAKLFETNSHARGCVAVVSLPKVLSHINKTSGTATELIFEMSKNILGGIWIGRIRISYFRTHKKRC